MEYRASGPEVVVMSAFGRHTDWLLNIEAALGPEVVVGREHFTATHRLLDAEEAMYVVRSYEYRHLFMAPVIRSVLSRFLGWAYSGSDSDLRRLVAQLPLVAFRPRS
jgi:hypothetical protein